MIKRDRRTSLPAMEEPEAHGAPTVRQVEATGSFLSKRPRVVLSPIELNTADLDHRDYFLVSLLDSNTTVEELLDICGMPSEEALALLEGLARRGVIAFDP
jgi:hypothetical protein